MARNDNYKRNFYRKKNAIKISIFWYVLVNFYWRRDRRWAVHPLNRSRDTKREYVMLCQELERYPEKYQKYFRMTKDRFDFLFNRVRGRITGQTTRFKKPISPKLKLVLRLRFLATGASFVDLAFRFRMGTSTVRKVIRETLDAIIEEMNDVAMTRPKKSRWSKIDEAFYKLWNFPNCLGSVDGKHVGMFCPPKSGSKNFNYKKTFSINLMAVADANYKFTMVDIGAAGSNHDATVFWNTGFGKQWFNQDISLDLPTPKPLPNTHEPVPYQLIADDAFGQTTTVMTPFPGTSLWRQQIIFNYRLSLARRVVENAFGILTHTWRILLKRVEANEDVAKKIVYACCTLHNFLRMSKEEINEILSEVADEPMETLNISTNRSTNEALRMRLKFAQWCTNEGDIAFQYKMI